MKRCNEMRKRWTELVYRLTTIPFHGELKYLVEGFLSFDIKYRIITIFARVTCLYLTVKWNIEVYLFVNIHIHILSNFAHFWSGIINFLDLNGTPYTLWHFWNHHFINSTYRRNILAIFFLYLTFAMWIKILYCRFWFCLHSQDLRINLFVLSNWHFVTCEVGVDICFCTKIIFH